jgi:hypothetical protein
MALDAARWSVNSTTKEIKYEAGGGTYAHATAGVNYVTVLELHRWLQSLADDATAGSDDYVDITRLNPTDKKFDTIITLQNGYFISDTTAEYIYGGSIIQDDGGGESIFDGVQIVANSACYVDVIQNGARLTNDFWNNNHANTGVRGINPNAATGVSARFMVKVKNDGADIDGQRLLFQTREWGKTYSEFKIPGTGRGINVVPLTYATDLNNATALLSVFNVSYQAPFDGITNVTAGFNLIDVDQNGADEEYYSEWNRGSASINQFYEYMKYLTRRTETGTIYGCPGELFRGITHSIAYSSLAGGTFSEASTTKVTWASGAGEGYILADDTTDDILYICQIKGPAPSGTLTQGGVTATAGTVTEKTVSSPVCGQSTGSSLVGAYGFSLEYADLTKDDKIQALDGTTRSSPNNVSFTVSGIKYGWRILVGPEDGAGGLKLDQLSNTNLLNGASVTTVTVDEAIPANTPSSGTIRIQRADGSYTRHPYSARSGTGPSTFTITSHDFSTNNAAAGANVFISYIDADAPDPGGGTIGVTATTASFNTVQSTTQTLFIEARYGGTGPNYTDSIKPAKTTGTLGGTGGSATISAVSDA